MEKTNAVIDLSHFNTTVDLQAAKGDGILGVIHKATQGLTFQDPTYKTNRQQANAAGLLWGAYRHFRDRSRRCERGRVFFKLRAARPRGSAGPGF